jgi:hypothetical protein
VTSGLREFSKSRDFSENRSVLSPSSLVTIPEGSSRRGKLNFRSPCFCDWNFQSQKVRQKVIFHLLNDPQTERLGDLRLQETENHPCRVPPGNTQLGKGFIDMIHGGVWKTPTVRILHPEDGQQAHHQDPRPSRVRK